MRFQQGLGLGVVSRAQLVCIVAGVVFAVLALQSAAADADALNWAPGVVVAPPANAGADPNVEITSLSCPTSGNCTAIGSYQDAAGATQGLVAAESGGHWGAATEAQLPYGASPINPDVSLTSISCATAGNCTAVGSYLDVNDLTQGIRLTQTSGSWAKGGEVIHPSGPGIFVSANPHINLTFVSCATATSCFVAGTYTDNEGYTQGLLETESGGSWSPTGKASLPADAASEPHVALNSGSCGAVGRCVAVGTYLNSSHDQEGLLLTGTDGSGPWVFTPSTASLPTGAAASPSVSLNSVSCAAGGACEAVGSYEDSSGDPQGLLLAQSGGTWDTGTTAVLPGDAFTNPAVALTSVSCPSAGNCDAVGDYDTSIGDQQALMLTETAGTWQPGAEPRRIPADANSTQFVTLSSVSCSAPSVCAATGNYADDSFFSHPLLLSQASDGSWSDGVEPALSYVNAAPNAYVEAVSCASGGDCSAVTEYTDQAGNQLVGAVNGTPSAAASTTLSITAPPTLAESRIALPAADFSALLSGGTSPSGTVSFTVFGPQDAPPSSCAYGGTTFGSASVSVDGPYGPGFAFTPSSPGDYWWYASYGGDLGNTSSLSSCGTLMDETDVQTPALTVGAPPATGLNSPISPSTVTAGLSDASSSASGTVTFTIFGPQNLPPTTCTAGGTAAGVATVQGNGNLNPGRNFTPPAVGDYWWYASYGGDLSDPTAASSCGAGMAETIVRASPTLSVTSAPSSATVGIPVSSPASATLSGGVGETGIVTFSVFGPQASPPSSCESPGTTVGTATVQSDGTYVPATGFTPATAGTYWWYARYGGDATDNAATSACGAQMRETVVSSAAITTKTPPAATTRIGKVITSGNVVKLTLTCHAAMSQSCVNTITVTATETVSAGGPSARGAKRTDKRVVTIGAATFKLSGGISRQESLRLNHRGTKLLAARHKLTALVKLRQGHTILRRDVTLHARASTKPVHHTTVPRALLGPTPNSSVPARRRPRGSRYRS